MTTPNKVFLLPQDSNSDAIHRAMGVPIYADGRIISQATKPLTLGSTTYADIYKLIDPAVNERSFIGIHVFNPSAAVSIEIVMGAFKENTNPDIVCPPSTFLTFDMMTYGQGARDATKDKRIDYIRARLSGAAGTLAEATIDYSGSGQPADQNTVTVHDKVYEFSSDQSKDPSSDVMVPIGATADITWTSFRDAVNTNAQAVTASIDTIGDIVTIQSVYGGDLGNLIVLTDGGTGAVFSGALGTSVLGAGGILPNIHIW